MVYENLGNDVAYGDTNRWGKGNCISLSSKEAEDIFFPKPGRPAKNPRYLSFCRGCRIINFCLSYAIVHDEEGVWGGMTKAERDSLGLEVKNRLTEEARFQGWYENRRSIEDILFERSLATVLDFPEPLLLPENSPFDLEIPLPQFHFDLVSHVQTQVVAYMPPVELPAVPQPLGFDNDQYDNSNEFQFVFPEI